MYTYKPQNVCAQRIDFNIRDGKIYDVKFHGGCAGNTKAIAALIEGLPVDEVVKRIKGIQCGGKNTSCGDQLAVAIEQYNEKK